MTHVIKFLSAKADELADVITRKTKAPAVRLIQDPVSCAIEGVTYLDGNKEVNVRANKGVVMCCGGFENNPEMMANYFKAYGCHPAAAVHNTRATALSCARRSVHQCGTCTASPDSGPTSCHSMERASPRTWR